MTTPTISTILETVERMLRSTELVVFGTRCRLVELEAYLYSEAHPDPFTHRHELQQTNGRWYFHRMGNSGAASQAYKNGSFRGLDLSFGGENAWGGILIRSIETPDGIIDGPCLCVNHVLAVSKLDQVKQLDELVFPMVAWNAKNPLCLQPASGCGKEIYRTGRVGLTLKKSSTQTVHAQYLLRRYRMLTEPRRVRKGRAHLIAALLEDGSSLDQVKELTGSPKRTIEKYAAWLKEGASLGLEEFRSASIGARELCQLHGLLQPAG